MDTVTLAIAAAIEKEYEAKGLEAARKKYKIYFVTCERSFGSRQEAVNSILTNDGYEDVICA